MNRSLTHALRSSTTNVWLLRIALLFVALGLALVAPSFALAASAQDVPNPFNDSAARDGAVSFVQSMIFWLWIASAAGLVIFAIGFFLQFLAPQLFQYQGYIKTGGLILIFVPMVVNFLLSQAQSAQTTGS